MDLNPFQNIYRSFPSGSQVFNSSVDSAILYAASLNPAAAPYLALAAPHIKAKAHDYATTRIGDKWNQAVDVFDFGTGALASFFSGGSHKTKQSTISLNDMVISDPTYVAELQDVYIHDPDFFDYKSQSPARNSSPRHSRKMAKRYKKGYRSFKRRKTSYKKVCSPSTMRKAIRQEMLNTKFDVYLNEDNGTSLAADGTAISGMIAAHVFQTENKADIAIGTQTPNYGDRNGNHVAVKSINLGFHIKKNAASITHTDLVRIMVFSFEGPSNSSTAGVAMNRVLADATQPNNVTPITRSHNVTLPYLGRRQGNPDNVYNYSVLADKIVTLSDGLSETVKVNFNKSWAGGHNINYTGEFNHVLRGGLYYILMTDAATNGPTYTVMKKVKYAGH